MRDSVDPLIVLFEARPPDHASTIDITAKKMGVSVKRFKATTPDRQARILRRLSTQYNRAVLIANNAEVFVGLNTGYSFSGDICLDPSRSIMILAATEEARTFLSDMVRAGVKNPALSWEELIDHTLSRAQQPALSVSQLDRPSAQLHRVGPIGVVVPEITTPPNASHAYAPEHHQEILVQWSTEAQANNQLEEAAAFLSKAISLGYRDNGCVYQLAKLYLRLGRPKLAVRSLRTMLGASLSKDPAAQSLLLSASIALGNRFEALRTIDRIHKTGDEQAIAHARSALFEIELDQRAEAMNLDESERPSVWWMTGPYPGNLGDILNPYIVEKLSGLPPKRAKAGSGILAIGSVIKFAKSGTQVWGTGTPRTTDQLNPEAEYRAVRGPITRDVVLKSGGVVPEIYGDPAMLLPLIYTPKTTKKHRVGLIRHYLHASLPLDLVDVPDIAILRVGYQDIEDFIEQLCSCEAILSTSLHGLIVAHAYGVPTRWCHFGTTGRKIAGDGLKFRDHYAALGIPCEEPLDLSACGTIDGSFFEMCNERMTERFNYEQLLGSAPFNVRAEVFEACRTGADVISPQRFS